MTKMGDIIAFLKIPHVFRRSHDFQESLADVLIIRLESKDVAC